MVAESEANVQPRAVVPRVVVERIVIPTVIWIIVEAGEIAPIRIRPVINIVVILIFVVITRDDDAIAVLPLILFHFYIVWLAVVIGIGTG